MDEQICEACGAKFKSRADLAAHNQKEHAHQTSDTVIAGQPPKVEDR